MDSFVWGGEWVSFGLQSRLNGEYFVGRKQGPGTCSENEGKEEVEMDTE